MAHEAVVVELYGNNHDGDPRRFEVYDSQAITKGTILAFSGARHVKACSADNDVVAGIAAMTKEAGDGSTSISAWTNGIFDLYCDAAVTLGYDLTVSAANILKAYTTLDGEKGYVLGKAMEAVGAAGDTINVRVNL
jgi:hypothetical protein